MNWEDILKVQVLGTKQKVKMGIKPLPKEDNNDCWKRLKEAVEFVSQAKLVQNWPYDSKSLIEEFDEDVACLAIQKFSEYDGGAHVGTFFDDYSITIDKEFTRFYVRCIIKVEARSRESDKQFCYINFGAKWQSYPTDYKPTDEQIRLAIKHNEKLFSFYNKFLNILGITPEYDTLPFYDKEWFDRRK